MWFFICIAIVQHSMIWICQPEPHNLNVVDISTVYMRKIKFNGYFIKHQFCQFSKHSLKYMLG